MAIEVHCPSCDKLLKAKDSMAGRTAKCPSCGSLVTIPNADEGVVEAEPVDEFESLASEGEAVDEPRRKPCPMCGESISVLAVRCRHCGEELSGKKKRKPQSGYSDDEMTTADWLLCILCPGIGCILGLIRVVQGNSSGGKMVGISILFAIIWNAISFAIRASLMN